MKMQATEVVHKYDFQKSMEELYMKEKYNEIFAISDSCEAHTVFKELKVPNVYGLGSS